MIDLDDDRRIRLDDIQSVVKQVDGCQLNKQEDYKDSRQLKRYRSWHIQWCIIACLPGIVWKVKELEEERQESLDVV